MFNIFDLILIFAFIVFVMYDYFKTKNKLKLLFFIPIFLSYPMLTTWPSSWTEQQFFIYRCAVILSCFMVGFIYIKGTKKQPGQLAKREKAQPQQAQKAKANGGKKKKKKK